MSPGQSNRKNNDLNYSADHVLVSKFQQGFQTNTENQAGTHEENSFFPCILHPVCMVANLTLT